MVGEHSGSSDSRVSIVLKVALLPLISCAIYLSQTLCPTLSETLSHFAASQTPVG